VREAASGDSYTGTLPAPQRSFSVSLSVKLPGGFMVAHGLIFRQNCETLPRHAEIGNLTRASPPKSKDPMRAEHASRPSSRWRWSWPCLCPWRIVTCLCPWQIVSYVPVTSPEFHREYEGSEATDAEFIRLQLGLQPGSISQIIEQAVEECGLEVETNNQPLQVKIQACLDIVGGLSIRRDVDVSLESSAADPCQVWNHVQRVVLVR
jgi:hypothetical protein